MNDRVRWLEDLRSDDTDLVGGKNASLGEMISQLDRTGIRVPGGFATTATAYWEFLDANDIRSRIAEDIDALHGGRPLSEVGAAIRGRFEHAEFPDDLAGAIGDAYAEMSERLGRSDPDVAVRSSATAEDLPDASFAGQQETFLNITGFDALLDACRRCYASLFTDRAINYREDLGFDQLDVALSIGVQQMVRSDGAGAGVMFSIDTDSGFPRAVLIDAAWGLGESVVAGTVDPDEYLIFKPLLDDEAVSPIVSKKLGEKRSKIIYSSGGDDPTEEVPTSDDEQRSFVLDDSEILHLARSAVTIEEHYGCPMDIEWAKDAGTEELFIVQARPETIHSAATGSNLRSYRLEEKGDRLVTGLAIGDAIATGQVCKLDSADQIDDFVDGGVLVTSLTDPDWEPIMKRAAAIVTDHGGRTSHAAIVSRELGVAAVIGAGDATDVLDDGIEVTVSCAEGDEGHVYAGVLDYQAVEIDLDDVAETDTKIMLNVADPAAAFRWWRLPADGVGLARMEFIINSHIGVHPMALLRPQDVDDEADRNRIEELTRNHADGSEFFVERLAFGLGRIAAAWHPSPVIVRLSDLKTNEYARLIGGSNFEPDEANPMLGWRGASRYHHDGYRDAFRLECRALRRVRDHMGLTNTVVMVPFCRSTTEADAVLEVMADEGLERGRNGLEIFVMAEVPSNIICAAEFAERFDGFSIGSNDLTQLTLGVDRDSARLAELFDEFDPAVTRSIERLIESAHTAGRKVGICGQRPSDDPSFATWLVDSGIDSISVTPDSFLRVAEHVSAAEQRRA